MPFRITLTSCLLVLLALPVGAHADALPATGNNCVQCHVAEQSGFNVAHSFGANDCVACHDGNAAGQTEQTAHTGLIAFPGNLTNAVRACGVCHAERVDGVTNNLMHTGHGIVVTTRNALDDETGADVAANLQSLGHGVADSLLRKQCASCHLGQPKTKHAIDVTLDRGGGCLACHINDYPQSGHPALTTRVDDGRCFGCHSRSGRISLSYAGLAEADVAATTAPNSILKLADGRTVQRLPADVHYRAGMSCVDCHTSAGLMGAAGAAGHQRQAGDISCSDCHDNKTAQVTFAGWPSLLGSMKKHVPFAAGDKTRFLTTAERRTPLWHIEVRNDDDALLHSKITNRQLRIPPLDKKTPGHDVQHQRLTCAACHSQWAPQCFGCHMEYEASGEQWDHIDRKPTAGRWSDKRWHVDNALPALGVNERGEIEAFVPGMIMTISHPAYDASKFVRQFAPLSPHTTGPARSCESCHRSSRALGLGDGQLSFDIGDLRFSPANELLQDGLPADAWSDIGNSLGGRTPVQGQRPLNESEMKKILEVDLSFGAPGDER